MTERFIEPFRGRKVALSTITTPTNAKLGPAFSAGSKFDTADKWQTEFNNAPYRVDNAQLFLRSASNWTFVDSDGRTFPVTADIMFGPMLLSDLNTINVTSASDINVLMMY